ncbi:hypothetical protein BGZ49_005389, partial [Haplosporangium sp. Z 27]
LPEPDSDAFISQEYEAPRDGIESTLAAIWVDLLKIERVGRNDNFFMLGGHSLLAIRVIKEVHLRLNFNLRLHVLFEMPTIANLAHHILNVDEKQGSSFDVLLPLKPHGNRLPLFCIHPATGLSWLYMGLSKHLHSDQPIYGLQARGVNGNGELAVSIEEMASDYVEQMRQIQPHGPYHLLGWSFGGNVAHTIAAQLDKLGEEVGLLGIMDSEAVIPNNLDFMRNRPDVDLGYIYRTLSEEDAETLRQTTRYVINNNITLLEKYSASVFSGDMVYFSATQSLGPDPARWVPFTLGKIEVHKVDCKHNDMDEAENLAVVGRLLA